MYPEYSKKTEELMKYIETSRGSVEQLLEDLQEQSLDMTLQEYLNDLLFQKGMTVADVNRKSTVEKGYENQIFNGRRKNPKREKLLAIAFAMELTIAETQNMLKIAQKPQLYPRNRKDQIILFALTKHYSLIDVNEILEDLGYGDELLK